MEDSNVVLDWTGELDADPDNREALGQVDAWLIHIGDGYIQSGTVRMAIAMRNIAQCNIVVQGIAVQRDLVFGDIMLEAGGDQSAAVDR